MSSEGCTTAYMYINIAQLTSRIFDNLSLFRNSWDAFLTHRRFCTKTHTVFISSLITLNNEIYEQIDDLLIENSNLKSNFGVTEYSTR